MSKTWQAECESFKKHPQGVRTIEVVVTAKYKKDAIRAAKKELEFWDAENHMDYKTPVVNEIEDEAEAKNQLEIYRLTKEKMGQMDIEETSSQEDDIKKFDILEAPLGGEFMYTAEYIFEKIGDGLDANTASAAGSRLSTVVSELIESGIFSDREDAMEAFANFNYKAVFPMETESQMLKTFLNIRELRHLAFKIFGEQKPEPTKQHASNEVEKTEMANDGEALQEATSQLTAKIATVAEYPIIEPYAIRLAVAKNEDTFIHSMAVINRKTGGSMVGQLDVFNPKPFSNIENAVVYGLAMAIDAVNAHLKEFLPENKLAVSVDILQGYAQDAEGNFIERCIINDYDLSNATLMAVSKPKESAPAEEPANPNETNVVGRTILKSLGNAANQDYQPTKQELEQMIQNLRDISVNFIDEFGADFWQGHSMAKIEAAKWTSVSDAMEWFMDKQNLCALYRKEWLCVNPKHEENKEPLEEEPPVTYYAGQQWRHYVKDIMAQFNPPLIDEVKIDKAAQNVAHVFNDWKIALFAEKDSYTTDAEIFKDEVYLHFNNSQQDEALEMLKSYAQTQAALCDVLANAYDEFVEAFANPKVTLELNNLVSRLMVDESLNCKYDSETVKALIYSELNANPVEDSTITNPTLKMQWWQNLSADFAKQQSERLQQNTPASELKQEIVQQNAPVGEQNTPNSEHRIELTENGVYSFEVEQALKDRVEEANELAKSFEQKICVHGDGTKKDNHDYSLAENPEPQQEIAAPEITPDPMPAQEFYGDKLLSGEIDAPYQYAIALMLKKHGAENYLSETDYQLAGDRLTEAINTLKIVVDNLAPGLTVEKMVENHVFESTEQALEYVLEESKLYNIAFDNVVQHEQEPPAESAQNEPEKAKQDFEQVDTSGPSNVDSGAASEPQHVKLTPRHLLKLQMRAANNHLGAMGLAWGYKVKRQWIDENDSHCEVAIWYRDKNGTKTEPMTFFGSTRAETSIDYVNDALTVALVNGLDAILFSLGLEVEG